MSNRYLRPAQRIFWGEGALGQLAGELTRLQATRILVVTGETLARNSDVVGAVEAAIQGPSSAGRAVMIHSGVRAHSPVASVLTTVDAIREFEADAVIALGGGSAIVTARGAAIIHGEERASGLRDLDTLFTYRGSDGRLTSPRLRAPKVPVVALPTSPTTAVSTAGCALTTEANGARLALFDPGARAKSVLMDPRLLRTAPSTMTTSSTLNALVMAIEGVIARGANYFTDAQLGHALRTLARGLPLLQIDEERSGLREQLSLAAASAGDGAESAGAGLAAAISHTFGHRARLGNGELDALILPYVLDFLSPIKADRLALLALALDCSPSDVRSTLVNLFDSAGVSRRLRDCSVDSGQLPEAARDAMTDFAIESSPRPVSESDALAVLRAAW